MFSAFFGKEQSKSAILIWLCLGGAIVSVTFQNCAGAQFVSDDNLSDEDRRNLNNCQTQECQDILNGKGPCTFNGQKIPHGAEVTAFQNSSVPSGQTCVSQLRKCQNGSLSGSYEYATCQVNAPRSCRFNGVDIAHGQSVEAYLNSNVATGQVCERETRTCQDGTLSGTYGFGSCVVGGLASCQFDGRTIPSGTGVFAFQNGSVPAGSSCVSQFRLCTNGVLSGSYPFGSCVVSAPVSCLFNGTTIPSGASVTAFQNSTVPFGQSCQSQTRICSNGALSGSYTFATCQPEAPASCQFNGQTITSGTAVVAFQNSSVPFGQACVSQNRVCTNGVLSGNYSFGSCLVAQPSACTFNGLTVPHGTAVIAFQSSGVAFGQSCTSESRTCSNGQLSGSFAHGSCSVAQPLACSFNGQTISHGQTVTAFQNSSVAFGQLCVSQSRSCQNGVLSGSYNFASCAVDQPAACLFNGTNVAHGANVTAYFQSAVTSPQVCQSEVRSCSNGMLSGSYSFGSCVVNQPRSCLFNGVTVASGDSVTAFQTSTVPFGSRCVSQTRTCLDGTLSGTFGFANCQPNAAASCQFFGQTVAHGQYVIAYKQGTVPYNVSCEAETRYCNNGVLSGAAAFQTCVTQPGANCSLGGQTILHGATVVAYRQATPPVGGFCESEYRTCFNGALSGSYSSLSCSPSQGLQSCTFNNRSYPHGSWVIAYKVRSGTLQQCQYAVEERYCNNGFLNGSAPHAYCDVL